MSKNIIAASIIILWIVICLFAGITAIVLFVIFLLGILVSFVIAVLADSLKNYLAKSSTQKEIGNINNQRIISLDYNQDTLVNNAGYKEEYFISKVNPKYVYYHNKENDSITLLDRDNGNLWLIQPSNRNQEYYRYKLKYQKTEHAISLIEDIIKNDEDYFIKEGKLLIKNYYSNQSRLPGQYA